MRALRLRTFSPLAIIAVSACAPGLRATTREQLIAEFRDRFTCRPVEVTDAIRHDPQLADEACWVAGAVFAEVAAGRRLPPGVHAADTSLLAPPRVRTQRFTGLGDVKDEAMWLVEYDVRGREWKLLAYVDQRSRRIHFRLEG